MHYKALIVAAIAVLIFAGRPATSFAQQQEQARIQFQSAPAYSLRSQGAPDESPCFFDKLATCIENPLEEGAQYQADDSIANGALIGGLIGGAFGIFMARGVAGGIGDREASASDMIRGGFIGAGIGASIGALIDALNSEGSK